MGIARDGGLSEALVCQYGVAAMDAAESWEPQPLQDLAKAAEKEKANLVRKRIYDEKAVITCKCVFVN